MGYLQPDPALPQDARGKGLRPKPFVFTDLAGLAAAGFDTIIDVRSPSEFAEDRVPGAVSMPVLSDAERARVGTIYVQDSPFAARRIGGALVARNTARHVEDHLSDKPRDWRPLVYCWRGGQRSGAFATVLAQIGWDVAVLDGGYRTWRRHVATRLYDEALPLTFIRLDGLTGTGKTAILTRVAAMGGQVIDLEGLARHRGSILGDLETGQPAQKGFESALMEAVETLDARLPVLVEAESARIGSVRLPPALWAAMRGAPRIMVSADPAARAAYLARDYADLTERSAALAEKLDGLRALAGHARAEAWQAMLAAGQHTTLAAALIADHYDPAYRRARARDDGQVLAELSAGDLSESALDHAARAVLERLNRR